MTQHNDARERLFGLGPRETQVYRAIANGKKVGEIGRTLFLSEKTISTYRARVLVHLDLKNNYDITIHAIQHGVITVQVFEVAPYP